MQIEFIKTVSPTDVAVSSARTCYSSKGIIEPEESSEWKRKAALLESIFKSGHHTTLQHTHITMIISGVSRHFVWRFLHSHQFYNSEQVSQRYAKVSLENMHFPKEGNKKEWEEFYKNRFKDYENLIEILKKPIENILPKYRKSDAIKKAQEIARYVLPQGTEAYLYHTVNIITLLRYFAVGNSIPEISNEIKEFLEILEKKLLELDRNLKPLIEFAKKERVEFSKIDFAKYRKQGIIFDVVGDLSFPTQNNYSGILRTSQMVYDEGVLGGFSSYFKLSLSADAQNQRHRKSFAIRPLLEENFKEEFYTPPILKQAGMDIFLKAMRESYKFFNSQKEKIGFSEAVYALPNSHLIEIVERTDWSSFHHKAQMRLCFNAQEEIYDIVYKQVLKIRELGIAGAEKLLPPCGIRYKNGTFPICPEGERFCGVKLWKIDFSNYQRKI